jgi:beta-glucosidase
MSTTQRIGLLEEGPLGAGPTDEEGTLSDDQIEAITNGHTRYAMLRWPAETLSATAVANNLNKMQELAESLPLGVPVLITNDPSFAAAPQLATWTGSLGFGAIDDEAYLKQVGAHHAAQLRATGVRWMLGPMVDVATEPMWARVGGTYGARPDRVGALARAYIQGFQGKDDGVNPFTGVAATVKHFPGHGAEENGMDSHSEFGQFNVFPGDNFEAHINAMRTAIEGVNPAAIMPCYSIFEDQVWDSMPVEQLGSSYSKVLLTDLLKGDMGFDGLITSDWLALGITFDGVNFEQGFAWGTDTWTNAERLAGYVEAGGHQIGSIANVRVQWEDALAASAITEEQIAANAQKALEVTFKVGAFEDPYVDPSLAVGVQEDLEDEAHESMMKAFTLLQNDAAILPLDADSANQNGTPDIQVFFDGDDDTTILAYTSNVAGFEAVADIADADYAIIRTESRPGGATFDGGTPLSYRDTIKVYDQDTNMPSDVDSTSPGFFGGPGAVENNAAANATADTIEAHIAAKGADTKLIFAVSTGRPWIWSDYLANTSVLAAEFGMSDEALLDMVFQMKDGVQDTSIQPSGKLPVEIPSSQDAVYAALEDVPHDSANPSFSVGDGITSY